MIFKLSTPPNSTLSTKKNNSLKFLRIFKNKPTHLCRKIYG